jgi:hypothetical protein
MIIEVLLFFVSVVFAIAEIHAGDALSAAGWGVAVGLWGSGLANRIIDHVVKRMLRP